MRIFYCALAAVACLVAVAFLDHQAVAAALPLAHLPQHVAFDGLGIGIGIGSTTLASDKYRA